MKFGSPLRTAEVRSTGARNGAAQAPRTQAHKLDSAGGPRFAVVAESPEKRPSRKLPCEVFFG